MSKRREVAIEGVTLLMFLFAVLVLFGTIGLVYGSVVGGDEFFRQGAYDETGFDTGTYRFGWVGLVGSFALFLVLGGRISRLHPQGYRHESQPGERPSSSAASPICQNTRESDEDVIRRGLAQYEADQDAEEREALQNRPPLTLIQIVEEAVALATIVGRPVSEEEIGDKYETVALSDFGQGTRKKVKAIVTSTPVVDNDSYRSFAPRFEGHLGTVMFAVNIIEERKLDSLWLAFDTYSDHDGLDLGIVNRFTMRVEKLVTVTRPDPGLLPVAGDEIDIVISRTGETDDSGAEVLSVIGYAVAKVEARYPRRVASPGDSHRSPDRRDLGQDGR